MQTREPSPCLKVVDAGGLRKRKKYLKNRTVFNRNMREVKRRMPWIYDKLKVAQLPENLVVEEARNGMPTLSLRGFDKSITIHSKYDPEQEAFHWAQSLGIQWEALVLFGAGLGYYLLQLAALYPAKKIILLEKDYGSLQLPLHYHDLTPFWKTNPLVIVEPDPQKVGLELFSKIKDLAINNKLIFKTYPSYEAEHSLYWDTIRKEFLTKIKSEKN